MRIIYGTTLMSQSHMSQSPPCESLTDFHTARTPKFGSARKKQYLCTEQSERVIRLASETAPSNVQQHKTNN